MHYRCFVRPGPGVSETQPGRAAGRTTRRCATVLSANSTGRAAQLLPVALARYLDRFDWRSASGTPCLAFVADSEDYQHSSVPTTVTRFQLS
jgi:hypothetical protein